MLITPNINGIIVSPFHLTEQTFKTYIKPVTNEKGTIEAAPKNIGARTDIAVFTSTQNPDYYIIQVPAQNNTAQNVKRTLTNSKIPNDLINLILFGFAKKADLIIIIGKKTWNKTALVNKHANKNSDLNDFYKDDLNLEYYDVPDWALMPKKGANKVETENPLD